MANLMIIDAVALERIAMKNILKNAGHNIVAETGACDDLEKLYQENKPDVIIMDIVFPENDGLRVLKDFLANNKDAKVIICTANAQQTIVIDAVQSGVKDFLVKPYQQDRLMKAIEDGVK